MKRFVVDLNLSPEWVPRGAERHGPGPEGERAGASESKAETLSGRNREAAASYQLIVIGSARLKLRYFNGGISTYLEGPHLLTAVTILCRSFRNTGKRLPGNSTIPI